MSRKQEAALIDNKIYCGCGAFYSVLFYFFSTIALPTRTLNIRVTFFTYLLKGSFVHSAHELSVALSLSHSGSIAPTNILELVKQFTYRDCSKSSATNKNEMH